MKIQMNGQMHVCPEGYNLADLITQLGYEGKRIAIELNGEIIPRSQYEQTLLHEGDVLELVVAVGGG